MSYQWVDLNLAIPCIYAAVTAIVSTRKNWKKNICFKIILLLYTTVSNLSSVWNSIIMMLCVRVSSNALLCNIRNVFRQKGTRLMADVMSRNDVNKWHFVWRQWKRQRARFTYVGKAFSLKPLVLRPKLAYIFKIVLWKWLKIKPNNFQKCHHSVGLIW